MANLENYFIILAIIQIAHSAEEILTNFPKKWPLWRMSKQTFISFELFLSTLLILVIFFKQFPQRQLFMMLFNLIMFANGVWHLMWAGIEKRYVPGLITAILFIIVFTSFYLNLF